MESLPTRGPKRFRTKLSRRLTENDHPIRERTWSEDTFRDHH